MRVHPRTHRSTFTTDGYSKVPNPLIRNLNQLSSPAVRLFLVIGSYKTAFPSFSEIVRQTGLCRASISKAAKELVALQIITVKRRGSRYGSNLYQIRPVTDWKLVRPVSPSLASSKHELAKFDPSTKSVPDDEPESVHPVDESIITKNIPNSKYENHQPIRMEDDSSILSRRDEDRAAAESRKNRRLSDQYLETNIHERQLRTYMAELQDVLDSKNFLKEVPNLVYRGIFNDRLPIELDVLIRTCDANMNGKREKFKDGLIENVKNKYFQACEDVEYDRISWVNNKTSKEAEEYLAETMVNLKRELEASGFDESDTDETDSMDELEDYID